MKRQRRKERLAWVLLMVFIPMLLLSSLHIHSMMETEDVGCYECQHHLQHAGHLTSAAFSLDDCLLCQMLSVSYFPVLLFFLLLPRSGSVVMISGVVASLPVGIVGKDLSRAPPFVVF
jgi:hypothetical protein